MPRTAANNLIDKGSETRRPIRFAIMQVAEGDSHHIPDSEIPCMNPILFTVQPSCTKVAGHGIAGTAPSAEPRNHPQAREFSARRKPASKYIAVRADGLFPIESADCSQVDELAGGR